MRGSLMDVQEVLQKMLKDYVIQQCRLRSSYAVSSSDGIVTEQMISKQALQVGSVFATLEFSDQVVGHDQRRILWIPDYYPLSFLIKR